MNTKDITQQIKEFYCQYKESIIVLGILCLSFFIFKYTSYQHLYDLPSIWYSLRAIKKHWQQITSISKFIQLSMILAFIYQISKIIVEKQINAKFSIYPEYLNNSISILAFLYSSFISMSLLVIVYQLYTLYQAITQKFIIKVLSHLIHLISILTIAAGTYYLYFFLEKNNYTDLALILDAYIYSDCTPSTQLNRYDMYLRKDASSCYGITINPFSLQEFKQNIDQLS